jgi:hypothetical protein
LTATGWVGSFEARVIVLVIGVLLVAGSIAFSPLSLLFFWLLADATFFHLVLITVLILVESFPK